MKRSFLALMLVFVCLFGLLAGCKNDEAESTSSPTETTAVLEEGELAGILLVNAGASVEVMYDIEGSVLQVVGYGKKGLLVAEAFTHARGSDFEKIVGEIVQKSVENDYLSDAKDMIILKHIIGSALPTKDFLDDAVLAAYNAAQEATIIPVTTDELATNGYISSRKAAQILSEYLSLEDANTITGRYTPHEGVYFFSAEVDGENVYYTVDGANGDIATCSRAAYEKDYYVAYGPEDNLDDYYEEIPTE